MSAASRHGLIGICLCAAVLAGCLQIAPTREPVTISYTHLAGNASYYQELIPLFNARHPHITVELRPERSLLGYERLTADTADAFELLSGLMPDFYEREVLLSLKPFVEQNPEFDAGDFYTTTLDMVTVDGEVWALPYSVQCGVMLYNKDLFDLYEVPYPKDEWTWDEFIETAAALTDPAAGVWGYAPHLHDAMYYKYYPLYIDPLYFVYGHGGRILDDWNEPQATTFDDPLTIEAVAWYADLAREHHVAPSRAEARKAFSGDPRGFQGFMMGKAAMIVGGPFDRFPRPGQTKAVPVGQVMLPQGSQPATFCMGFVNAVSAESRNAQAAWQWISFLSEQTPHSMLPARRSLAESAAYEQQVGADTADMARTAVESAGALPFHINDHRSDAIECFYEAVIAVSEGEINALDAMQQAQQHCPFD